MTSGSVAVVVEELTVALRRGSAGDQPTVLVDGISYAVGGGEVLGLVGETGAGKTMTVRGTFGLLPGGVAAHGVVTIGEERVELSGGNDTRRFLGRRSGLVLQNPFDMLDPLIRVGAQMMEGVTRLGLLGRREATERAAHLLQALGLHDVERVLRAYPSELSGGMAQRVTIAMALMPRPLVVAVDEPTSALDAQSRIEVLDLIRRLCAEEGTGVIFVSHDLGLVGRVCDTVAVMYAGRIVEQGSTASVLHDPRHPYTKALLACAPTVGAPRRQRLPHIDGSPPRPGTWPSGCTFAPRCPYVDERGRSERPPLRAVDGRMVACHRAEELLEVRV